MNRSGDSCHCRGRRGKDLAAGPVCGGRWYRLALMLVIGTAAVGRSLLAEDPAPVLPPVVEQSPGVSAGDGGLSFIRVQVPPGRLAEVVPAGTQYVPMSAVEFEEAVGQFAGLGGRRLTGLPRPAADLVRYQLRLDEAGRLVGQVEFAVNGGADPATGLPAVALPVGQIDLRNCRWRAAGKEENAQADEQSLSPAAELDLPEGSEVDLFGLPDGSLELRVPGPGVVTAAVSIRPTRGLQPQVQAVPLAGGQPEFSYLLPLVPALSTTLQLELPAGLEPRIPGCRGRSGRPEPVLVAGEPRRFWEFAFGPRDRVRLTLAAATSPRLFLWSRVHLSRRAKELTAVIVPAGVWTSRELAVTSDPRLQLTQLVVQPDDGHQAIPVERLSPAEEPLAIRLPVEALGRGWPLQLRAVLATDAKTSLPDRLPGIALEAWQWAGGGLEVTVAADLQCVDIDADGCRPIPPEEAARWPLPAVSGSSGADATQAAGARLVFESQRPGATVRAVVAPQRPELDIARVTTIDLTTAAVIGRAACDIQVRRGSIHRLEAIVGEGWFIDSIEPLGQPTGDGVGSPLEALPDRPAITAARGEATVPAGQRYEWKVVRERRGDRLILDLPTAVTTDRELRLRITGHRSGIPAGGRFSSADVEMVRLVGETPGRSWIDLQTGSDTTLQEIGGVGDEPPPTLPPRLLALSEGTSWRQRVAAGTLTPPRSFRLLRRRPPLEVETQARFTVRGERLNETYSFVCQPLQGQLDTVTVHFSEPVGELDWSILAAGEATVFARRLEPVDRSAREGPAATPWPAAASYRIEITPPMAGSGTLRATAARGFTEPTPLPLAWVEAAVAATGETIVQAVGQERPLVENRRLTELPPRERHGDAPLETVAELAYDMRVVGVGNANDPAAVLVPAPVAARPVARAWVWRERTTVRCFASAAAEFETSFELENDGRRSIQLSLPADHRLLGVTVGGERMPLLAAPTGELPIFLPSGSRRLTILVRTATVAIPRFGLWRLSTDTPTVDAPTLLREWQLLLPNALSVAAIARGYREVDAARSDWTSRLVGGVARAATFTAGQRRNGGIDRAFRSRRFVPTAGRYERHYFLLVDRFTLVTAAGLAALVAAGLAIQVSWRGSWLLLAAATLLAVAALWVPQPLDLMVRSGLWAVIAVAILRLRGITKPVGIGGLVLLATALSPVPAAAEEKPLRVFFTPVDEGLTALVPQPLFRVLAGAETAAGLPGTRLLDCRVEPQPRRSWRPDGSPDVWWLNLLVESDAATVLTLDQAPTESRFAALPVRLDGGVVRASLSSDRRRLTLPLPAAGRHTVTVPLEPAWNRRGDLEIAEVRLPVSPQTSLSPVTPEADNRGGRRLSCEWSRDGRVFQQATASQARENGQQGYRLPAASLLRLIRPVDPEGTLVSAVREAESRNRLVWDADACRLTAEFTIDTGAAILPTVWLQADSRLVPAVNDPADQPAGVAADYELMQVAPGVYRIDRQTPVRGEVRFEIPFTMPLTGPVGVFELPDVWLRGVRFDHREVLLAAAADLDLTVRFPGSAAPPLLEDSFAGIRWSADIIETSLESGAVGSRGGSARGEAASGLPPLALQRQPVMLEVTRSVTPVRGRQQVEIIAGNRDTRLVYEAVIDARATVWVEDRLRVPEGFEIEACQLSEQQETGDAAVAGRPVDLVRTAGSSGSQRLVLQRPRPGRYLLRLEARRGRPLPAAGPLPLISSEVAATLPYSVLWVDAAGQGRPELFEAGEPRGRAGAEGLQSGEADAITGVAVEDPAGTETWRIDLPVNNAAWSYRTTGLSDAPAADSQQASKAAPASGDMPAATGQPSPSRAAVELADIEIVIDERGRLSGIGRFDLTTSRAEVGLRLPEGFRLFELLVDGREVQPAVPDRQGPDDVWRIPLRASLWPREIVVVFVGEIGIEAMQGEPVSFEPPLLTELPIERMIWTLDYPASHSPLVAGEGRTARPAEAGRIRGEASAAIDRLLAAFTPQGPGAAASRIERFRGLRRPEWSPLEAWAAGRQSQAAAEEWTRGIQPLPGGRLLDDPRWSRLTLLPSPGRPAVTVRFRPRSAEDSGRTAATLLVFLAGAAGWWSVTRRPGRTFAAAARWWPAVAGLGGVAWLLAREPLWPGVMVVAVVAATLADRWLRACRERLPPAVSVAEAETIEYRRDSAVGASSVTRTAIAPRPGMTR
mgnify:CR=1 FL=1